MPKKESKELREAKEKIQDLIGEVDRAIMRKMILDVKKELPIVWIAIVVLYGLLIFHMILNFA